MADKALSKDLDLIQEVISGEHSRFRIKNLKSNAEIVVLNSGLKDYNSSMDQTHNESKPVPKKGSD